MKKLLTPIVCLLFVACSKTDVPEPIKEYTLTIDSVLTRDGRRSLPKDSNGFYHLRLEAPPMGLAVSQQNHRVTGKILVNGLVPKPAEKIEWESNLYWYLQKSDTIGRVVKSYINYYNGQFTIVELPPLIAGKDELIPTINSSSYNSPTGEINTIIAPITNMKGDTMVIKASNWSSKKMVLAKIILE